MKINNYFGFITNSIVEGGDARSSAFNTYFTQNNCQSILVYGSANQIIRLFRGLRFVFFLLMTKEQYIFIHYIFIRHVFTDRLLGNSKFASIISWIINYASAKSTIIIEVNDLPYEQAIDLELPHNNLDKFDIKLYNLKSTNFVFASNNMRNYVVDKYNLPYSNTSVLINGGPCLNDSKNLSQIKETVLKFVYAGSLNKGRQIEDMINIFSKTKHKLFLLGSGGDWLKSRKFPNVNYIGALRENEAHEFVSNCDVGLIPYDSSRFYYNLCYPTKASFYITAGLPFISTVLDELEHCFDKNVAIFANINEWEMMINEISLDKVHKLKCAVKDISCKYEWNSLIHNWVMNTSFI